MRNNEESSEVEFLTQIGRISGPVEGIWNPCLRDMQEHEFNPLWVASVLYLIYDRYLSSVSEENQIEFEKNTLIIFKELQENGYEYIYKKYTKYNE